MSSWDIDSLYFHGFSIIDNLKEKRLTLYIYHKKSSLKNNSFRKLLYEHLQLPGGSLRSSQERLRSNKAKSGLFARLTRRVACGDLPVARRGLVACFAMFSRLDRAWLTTYGSKIILILLSIILPYLSLIMLLSWHQIMIG